MCMGGECMFCAQITIAHCIKVIHAYCINLSPLLPPDFVLAKFAVPKVSKNEHLH